VKPVIVSLSSAAEIGSSARQHEFIPDDVVGEPISPYGVGKVCQAEVLLNAGRRLGLRVVSARIFNIIDLPRSPESPVQSWAAQVRAMRDQGAPRVLKTGVLEVERDFLTTDDVVQALVGLATSQVEGRINIASGRATRLTEIVQMLRELAGFEFTTEQEAARLRTRDLQRVVASTAKLQQVLGRKLEPDLRAAVQRLLA
jgi:nucleoside-diphosphate-sugar epimerase